MDFSLRNLFTLHFSAVKALTILHFPADDVIFATERKVAEVPRREPEGWITCFNQYLSSDLNLTLQSLFHKFHDNCF